MSNLYAVPLEYRAMDEIQNSSIIQKLLFVHNVLDDSILKFSLFATYITISSHFSKPQNTYINSFLFCLWTKTGKFLLNFKAQYREFIISKEFVTFQPDLLLLCPIIQLCLPLHNYLVFLHCQPRRSVSLLQGKVLPLSFKSITDPGHFWNVMVKLHVIIKECYVIRTYIESV